MLKHVEVVRKCKKKFDGCFNKALDRIHKFETENLKELQDEGIVEKGEARFNYVNKFVLLSESLKNEIFRQFFNSQLLAFLKFKVEKLKELHKYKDDTVKLKKGNSGIFVPFEKKFDQILQFPETKQYLGGLHSNMLYQSILKSYEDKSYKGIKESCKVIEINNIFLIH